jgi:hypothetical protein
MGKKKWVRVGPDLKPVEPTEPEPPRWKIDTKEKAIADVLKMLSPASRALIKNTKEEELIGLFHKNWGMDIRARLGLWGKNVHLLHDLSRDGPIHADEASSILMKAAWRRLQEEG